MEKDKKKYKNESLVIVGNNVNSLPGKADSMKSMLNQLNVGILMIQETKMYRPGNIKLMDLKHLKQ